MARGDLKANPWIIVQANWRTYVDAEDGAGRWQDWVVFTGPPVTAGALLGWRDVELNSAASAGLLTVTGLLSVFLFGVIVQLSGRAMDYADSRPKPSKETSAHATYLLELAASAGYASLICIVAAVDFVVASLVSNLALRISSAIGLALGVHLIMVLLMVMKRQFALTQERLNRARTGADLVDSPASRGVLKITGSRAES